MSAHSHRIRLTLVQPTVWGEGSYSERIAASLAVEDEEYARILEGIDREPLHTPEDQPLRLYGDCDSLGWADRCTCGHCPDGEHSIRV